MDWGSLDILRSCGTIVECVFTHIFESVDTFYLFICFRIWPVQQQRQEGQKSSAAHRPKDQTQSGGGAPALRPALPTPVVLTQHCIRLRESDARISQTAFR